MQQNKLADVQKSLLINLLSTRSIYHLKKSEVLIEKMILFWSRWFEIKMIRRISKVN